MKKRTLGSLLIPVVTSLLLMQGASSQVLMGNSVLGSGGGLLADSSNRVLGTVGQSVTGIAKGASNNSGAGFWYQSIGFITKVEMISNDLPKEYRLEQNYPNPFNPSTIIQFSVPRSGYVRLRVWNLLGQEVATLLAEELKAGRYEAEWNAGGLASGVYLYRLEAPQFVETRRMVLIK